MTSESLSATGQPRIYRAFTWLATLAVSSSWLLTGFRQTKSAGQEPGRDIRASGYFRSSLEQSDATRGKHAEPLHLFTNGYFPALHGYFFLEGEKLHVYRALQIVLSSTTGNWGPSPEDDELKNVWKGEPYYHEIYELDEGEWVPKMWGSTDTRGKREFSRMPEQYLKFTSCDQNDKLDLHNDEIQRTLWRGTKQKDSVEFDGYAAVLFSVNPATLAGKKPPPYKTDERPVQLALLRRGRNGWEFPPRVASVSTGNYCGMRTLSSTRTGEPRTVLVVFFEEGSYAVAYSYVAD